MLDHRTPLPPLARLTQSTTTAAFSSYKVLCAQASGISSDLFGPSPLPLLLFSKPFQLPLFLKHDKTHYASGPLPSLFPLPGTFFL